MSTPDYKYARGVSARPGRAPRELKLLEYITLAHVAVFSIGATWAFGGGAPWVKTLLAWWGSLGILITLSFVLEAFQNRPENLRALRVLWPFALLNGLTIGACFVPNFREIHFGEDLAYAPVESPVWLPSSALPAIALRSLWLFDGIVLSCFNLVLVIRQRRVLRSLLIILAINTLALSIFGTLQKFSGSKGLYFDAVPSPQPFFFSSFIYHNHWGSFIVSMVAACLALMWHYSRRREERGRYSSPVFTGLVALFFIAVTVPLSTSRSCTMLLLVLFSIAFLHWLWRLAKRRSEFNESIALPVLGAVAGIAVAGVGVWFMAHETIEARVAKTKEQVAALRARDSVDPKGRPRLYADTWAMAKDRLWFGWGTGSYPYVFMLYNTAESKVDRLPVYYHDAHSDWLQSIAEHGLIGTLVLGLCVLVPLLKQRWAHLIRPLPAYLLLGCTLLVLYAWVEFPFGNTAVVLNWWICFCTALAYTQLIEKEFGNSAPSSAAA